MKMRVDLQKSVIMPNSNTLRYADGDFDAATGILWLDEMQGATATSPGRKIRAGQGIHLASRATIQKIAPPPVEEAKPAAKKTAAA